MSLSEDFSSEIRQEITKISDILDIYSETSEITELNKKKELVCTNELVEIIKQNIVLNSIYGDSLDISSGELNMLWNYSLDNGKIPSTQNINNILKKHNNFKDIKISGNTISLENNISLDLGASAKGYALDIIYNFCEQKKINKAIISFGSSTLLYSTQDDYQFNVAIKKNHYDIAGVVKIGPCFVSTSGDYERFTEIDGINYHHILDLKTGYPSESNLSSVTVFCNNGIESDFLSTIIFIEGKENLEKHLSSDRYKIVAVDTDGKIYKSDSIVFTQQN